MAKYIALLRGINVGGKNKISMSELKAAFLKKGFKDVMTYINSGNVIFESDLDKVFATTACEELIEAAFGLKITVLIIAAAELLDATAHAPEWWNNTEGARNDVLFIIPPMTVSEFLSESPELKLQYENRTYYSSVIFWTTQVANFNRASISKLAANKKLFHAVTIRNVNTTMKLAELVKSIEDKELCSSIEQIH